MRVLKNFFGALLSRRDWAYLLSLLVPFVVYNLALKAYDIASRPGDHGLGLNLHLMRSDLSFDLGYVMLWIGLFAVARGGLARRAVVFLFHAVTILVVLLTTCAHQYFQETGSTLDYGILALWLPKLKEAAPVLTQGVPALAWVLLAAVLLYAALGPLLVTHIFRRRGRRAQGPASVRSGISLADSLGLFILALGFGSFSLLADVGSADASKTFARDPVINVVLTGFENSGAEENADVVGPATAGPATDASIAPSQETQKRNVVLVHLESTRAESVTPYNQSLDTTPFLDKLARDSLVAERDYTTVPHTSKASVSVNCGIEPDLIQTVVESEPGRIPAPCLPSLLKDQGYNTALFQSSVADFENFNGLAKNFGYADYYPLESMDTKGFQRSNYFGYEDDIMLKPSQDWLESHKDKPFMAEYLMGTGHHDYQCLGLRYGDENYSNQEPLNSYLNCLRYQDHFVENLIDQYKQEGLYENTIFVFYGDHGEGFGEHGLNQHDDTIYEEGIRVPLIIHAPGITGGGGQVEGLSNHTDILPTVLEMLGYDVKNGEYPGYSLLHPLPEDRTLDISCWHDSACMASIQGNEKYIYHYGNQPDEIFDLSKDPLEKNNLAGQYTKEELAKRRDALLAWRASVNATYGSSAKNSQGEGTNPNPG